MDFSFETRVCFFDSSMDEALDNESRLLAPTSPFHPLWDDVQDTWLRDWQVN